MALGRGLAMGPGSLFLFVLDVKNPLTPFALLKTILFQDILIGGGCLFIFLGVLPWLAPYQGMHPIQGEEQAAINQNPALRFLFGKAKRWYNHMWLSLLSTGIKVSGFMLLSLTLFILLTDVGWLDAWQSYSPDWSMIILMARASGAPNGAHLLSYIPLPILGAYVAWKYRKTSPGNSYVGDVYQGILIVGFGVAAHEGVWIIAYIAEYYRYVNLGLVPNVLEDIGFSVMCLALFVAFWKYPFRRIPLKIFILPMVLYCGFILVWFLIGLPITTINNYQIGHGVFEVTQWWDDPTVNSIEIESWLLVAIPFLMVVWKHKEKIER